MPPNNSDIIANNGNENSIDPNPYAYPYFHIKSTPLLYKLILTNFGVTANDDDDDDDNEDEDEDDNPLEVQSHDSSSSFSSQSKSLHKKLVRKRQFIAKRIHSRLTQNPKEVEWHDSCGETALFRFCQLIRFIPTCASVDGTTLRSSSSGLMKRIGYLNSISTSGVSKTKISNTRTEALKLILTLETTPELIFFVFNSFIETDPNATNVLNKWRETPLHQFVNHCGFTHNKNITSNNNYTNTYHRQLAENDHHLDITTSTSHAQGLSLLFLDAILKSSPQSIYQTNFQRSLPLHLACSLSNYNTDQPFSSSDSMVAMDSFIKTLSSSEDYVTPSTSSTRSAEQLNYHHHDEHLMIIKRLVEYYPKGVLAIDLNGCTPLFRAVDSIHCSADIVSFLLSEMESTFIQYNERDSILYDVKSVYEDNSDICTKAKYVLINHETTKFLLFKAIMGFNKEKQTQNDGIYDTKGKRTKGETTKVLSPMACIWKTILQRRQVKHNIPGFMDHMDPSWASIADIFEGIIVKQKRQYENNNIEFGPIWDKMMHLIYCAYYGSMKYVQDTMLKRPQDLLPLHAAIYCAAPISVLNLFIKLNPDHLYLRDSSGDTPLLLTMKCPSYPQQWDLLPHDEDNDDIYSIVLRAAPKAAKITNTYGRLPLHIAIQNGMNWNEGLEDLFTAFPNGSQYEDTANDLLPFMIACSLDAVHKLNSLDKLTNAYMLLRADPSVLCSIAKHGMK